MGNFILRLFCVNHLVPLFPFYSSKSLSPNSHAQPPVLSVSQDTLLTTTSDPTTNASTSLEALESNPPPPPPLRNSNVRLIVERRKSVKRSFRQRFDTSPLACPLCGRVFKKKKFFDDHCALCQQVNCACFLNTKLKNRKVAFFFLFLKH